MADSLQAVSAVPERKTVEAQCERHESAMYTPRAPRKRSENSALNHRLELRRNAVERSVKSVATR